jgi:hypothetical protein
LQRFCRTRKAHFAQESHAKESNMQTEDRNRARTESAFTVLEEVRGVVNLIATAATAIGQADVEVSEAASKLALELHEALLEFEMAMANQGRHTFKVKK